MGGLSNGPIPDPHVLLGIKNDPFQIATERLEIDENVNRARFSDIFWLCSALKNHTAFPKAQNV